MKIIISFLILSFAHLIYAEDPYMGNWEPTAENCDKNALRQKRSAYRCSFYDKNSHLTGKATKTKVYFTTTLSMREVKSRCRKREKCLKREECSVHIEPIASIYDRGNDYREKRCEERKLAEIKEKDENDFNKKLAKFVNEDWQPSAQNCSVESLSEKGPGTVYRCTVEESIRRGKRQGEPKSIKISLVETKNDCTSNCPDYVTDEYCKTNLQPFETLYAEKNVEARQNECVAWKLEKENDKQLANIEKQIKKGQNQCRIEENSFEKEYKKARNEVNGVFVGENNTQNEQLMQAVNNVLIEANTDADKEAVEAFCNKKRNKEKLLCLEEEKKNLEQKIVDAERDLLDPDQNITVGQVRTEVARLLFKYENNLDDYVKTGKADSDFKEHVNTIIEGIQNKITRLESLELSQLQACRNRYEQYNQIRNSCYNKGMEVAIEARNEHYSSLDVSFANVSNVFSNNFRETQESNYTKILMDTESDCLENLRKPVSCKLETLRNAKITCKEKGIFCIKDEEQEKIENVVLQNLEKVDNDKQELKDEFESLYVALNELKDHGQLNANGMTGIDLIVAKIRGRVDGFFNDSEAGGEYHQIARKHQDDQLVRLDRINKLEKDIKEKKQNDSFRHLAERWRFANELCCQPVANLDLPKEEHVKSLGEKQLGSTSFCTALNEHIKKPQLVQLMSFPVPSILSPSPSKDDSNSDTQVAGSSGGR